MLQPFRQFAALLRRILHETGLVLGDRRCLVEIPKAQKAETVAEDGVDFLELVRVTSGDDESRHGPRAYRTSRNAKGKVRRAGSVNRKAASQGKQSGQSRNPRG